jgi:type VI secretion system protein ImpF
MQPSAQVLPSVFNRLVDVSMGDTDRRAWYSVADLIGGVRSDLEDLLNTRQPMADLDLDYQNLGDSILNYGVPDPSRFALETPLGRRRLASCLASIIRCFEPRLHSVMVEPLTSQKDEKFRELRFRVTGRLAIESAPQVIFESTLHVPSGQYKVKESN